MDYKSRLNSLENNIKEADKVLASNSELKWATACGYLHTALRSAIFIIKMLLEERGGEKG